MKWYMVDVAIALQNVVLTATSEGLGTCWVGSFKEDQVKDMLKIPERFKVVALLAIGYSSENFNVQDRMVRSVLRRKPLKKIASFEEYGSFKL
jgi:nitroreductase